MLIVGFCWVSVCVGVHIHVVEDNWLVLLMCEPSVPVLIRHSRLGSGERLPGLLTGESIE